MRIKIYSALLSIFLTIICASQLQAQVCVVSDSLELVKLYNATNGPNWTTPWDLNAQVNSWYGVSLDALGNVACLDMDGLTGCNITSSPTGNNLDGNLGNLNLPFLRHLILSGNKISGNIPELDILDKLETLDLSLNEFTGNIPEFNNLANLTFLQLSFNSLSGSIPDFDSLSQLRSLDLSNNQLIGSIPQFNNFEKLDDLHLYQNKLTGNIPPFDNLVKLKELRLEDNQLSGIIPPFDSLQFLRELYLRKNKFDSISSFQHLINLQNLFLQENKLNLTDLLLNLEVPNGNSNSPYLYSPQDSVPLVLESGNTLRPIAGGNIADNTYNWYLNNKLIYTTVGDDEFYPVTTGTYFCKVSTPDLPSLNLNSKALYANTCLIHDSLQLLKIYTATNGQNWDTLWNLSEPISTWHGISLTADGCHVESIDFGFFGNGLTGTFPALNLGELKTLKLIRNEITAVESLEGLPSLESLELSNNELTELPSLENLQNLENLYLANNQLASIPDYSSLTKLKRLSLFNNQLEQVPDYSGLALLERLYLYNNRLSSLPAYDGLTALAFLSIDGNRLAFSDISPSTAIPNFSYAPQDSLALSLDQGELIFNVGGNLADNTYTWYKNDTLQNTIMGDSSFLPTGEGIYRCEASNSELPNLALYSKGINICLPSVGSQYFALSDISAGNPPYCLGDELAFQVTDYTTEINFYSFFVNGLLMQESNLDQFSSNTLQDGDVVSLLVKTADGCQFIPVNFLGQTLDITVDFHDEIDLLICQDNPNQFNAKLQQGTPPWNFNLVEYSNGLAITSTTCTVQDADINIPRNPDNYYEITEVADANCSSNNIFSSPKVNGCGAVCVGYSNPQVEYYTADFSKPVSPGNMTWTISPAAALSAGDVEIISGNNDFVLQLNFPNAAPSYTEITLTATAQTDCGTEILEKRILLDKACVWPGDINDDGEVRTGTLGTPGIPWIDDAIALSEAISVQCAIGNSENNETLLPYPRPPSCLAEKTYDWVPQSARNWEFDSSGTIRPVYFSLFNDDNNSLDFFNLKYADADGNGYLDDTPHFNPFEDDFDTLSVISDIDVVAYHEHLNNSHNDNVPSSFKTNNLSELIQITVPDTVFASGDEVVFRATLGDADNVLDSVVQVAFRAEGAFGTYQRPEVRLAASHLSINFNDLVDYPFLLPNAEGVAADSLEWLLSLHSPNFIAKQFDGDELCSVGCHVVIAGFADENQQAKNFTNPLGVPSTFKITVGIKLANGRIIYAQSNEVTIYIKPDPYLSARVFLEGAYEDSTGLMRNDLRLGQLIPATEPYSAQAGYPFPKGELREIGMTDGMAVLSVTGQEAIVDWVLVEVWEDSSRICSRPALLTRNGQVVDTDGSSAVPMNRVPYGDYHIVIRHRNHLPVISSSPINLQRGVATLDFTNQNTAGQAEIAPGVYGLYAGDATLEYGYTIHGQDNAYWSGKNGYSRIYEQADFDMDTDVNAVDKVIWKQNNGVFVEVPR